MLEKVMQTTKNIIENGSSKGYPKLNKSHKHAYLENYDRSEKNSTGSYNTADPKPPRNLIRATPHPPPPPRPSTHLVHWRKE